MALQVLANGCSVYEITGKSADGNPTIVNHAFKRGDVLPDWVDEAQRFVLVSSGMAAEVGDSPDDSVRPLDTSAPVVVPNGPGAGASVAGEDSDLATLPADTDTKFVWENYAVSDLPAGKRMTRPEAESMKKTDLVTEVKNRYNEALQEDDDLGNEVPSPKF